MSGEDHLPESKRSTIPGNPLPGSAPEPGGFRPVPWLKKTFRWFFAWDFAAWFAGGLLLFAIVSLLWPEGWDPTPSPPPLPPGICATCQGRARFPCPDCEQGFTTTGLVCERCKGQGWLPCPSCEGTGKSRVLPAGQGSSGS